MRIFDRIFDTSHSVGTGNIAFNDNPPTGFDTFSSFAAVGDRLHYCIAKPDGSEWEMGIGTLVSATTFNRLQVLSNSLGTLEKINFTSGRKDVYSDVSAQSHFDQVETTSELPPAQPVDAAEILHMVSWGGQGGDVTIADAASLSRCQRYSNLTVNAALAADGVRVIVQNTLVIGASGSITANGIAGPNASTVIGGTQPAAPPQGEFNYGLGDVDLGRGSVGGGAGDTAVIADDLAVGDGGNGGNGATILKRVRPSALYWLTGQVSAGGAGGTGGDGSSDAGGGAGGNGGGRLVIIADTIINLGQVEAKGGNGGNGADGPSGNDDGGDGGSGGGGGLVYIICRRYIGNLPVVTGGVGGNGGNASGAGSDGTDGLDGDDGNFVIYSLATDTYRENI